MGTIQTIIDRWNADLPSFFKSVRTLALSVGGVATAILTAGQTMSLAIPPSILTACNYVIAICAAMGLTAQLTKADKPAV